MSKKAPDISQTSLFLRLLGGGYLVYLTWDLRETFGQSLFFTIALIVFGLVGVTLLVHTLWKLLSDEYFRKSEPKEPEEGTEEIE